MDLAARRQYWGRHMAMLPPEQSRSLNPTMTMFDQVWESLFFVAKNDGTLLTITHDIDVARSLNNHENDRIMVMKKGKLLEQGTGEQVLNYPMSDYAKQLIAAAPHNWSSQDRTAIQDSPYDKQHYVISIN